MNRIMELRQAKGMTQEELGHVLNVGKGAVSRYEQGKRQLTPGAIHAICDYFGCTADYLLGRSQSPQPVLTDRQLRLLAAYDGADPRDRDFIDHLLRLDVPEEKKKAV